MGVIAASKRMFKHLGARFRVTEPTTEGDIVEVHEALCHYALVCTMVAEALDTIITGSSSGGTDGSRFKLDVEEAVSLDFYLPQHNRPQNGLAIVDGANPNRSVFPDEYMPGAVDDMFPSRGPGVVSALTGSDRLMSRIHVSPRDWEGSDSWSGGPVSCRHSSYF